MYVCQAKVEDHRRKWDRDEYERLAQERLEEEELEIIGSTSHEGGKREPPVRRELLKPREYKVGTHER